MDINIIGSRRISVIGFSFLFAYLLSFVFEGQVLYGLTEYYQVSSSGFIFAAIIAHFIGLFSCGFFVKTSQAAKNAMLYSIAVSLAGSIPFFLGTAFSVDRVAGSMCVDLGLCCGGLGAILKKLYP